MKTINMNQPICSNQAEWKLLVEEGIGTDGIFAKFLRFNEATQKEEVEIF